MEPSAEPMDDTTAPAPEPAPAPAAEHLMDSEAVSTGLLDRPLSSARVLGGEHRPAEDRGDASRKRRLPGNMAPRKRPEVAPQVQLAQEIITKLGDYSTMEDVSVLKNNIEMSAAILSSSDHLRAFPQIAAIFAQALSQLSVQTSILTSLLTLIHTSMPDFSEAVVANAQSRLLTALQQADIASARLLLRAFACLASSGCLSMSSFVQAMEAIADVLVSGDEDGKQEAAYLLASTLVWVEAHEDNKALLAFVTPGLRAFLQNYTTLFGVNGKATIVRGPLVWNQALHSLHGFDSTGAFDNLQEALVLALHVLEGGALPQGVTIKYATTNATSLLLPTEFIQELKVAPLGKKAREGASPSWLRMRLPVLTTDASEEINAAAQALSFHDKVVALGYIQDVLHFFDPIVLEDGTRLGSLDLLMSHLLAVPKLFPDVSAAALHVLVVEHLFHLLLQPATSKVLSAQAAKLLLALCKAHAEVAPTVAHAANLTFQLLPELQASASIDFVRWFTFHYVNTKLTWPLWEFWLSLCQPPGEGEEEAEAEVEPRVLLTFSLRCVARRLGCLLGEEKVKNGGSLPSELLEDVRVNYAARCALFSPQSEVSQCSLLQHDDARAWAKSLHEMLHDRASADDILDWFDRKAELISDEMASGLLLHALLFTVADDQTATAIISMLERYDTTIRALGETAAAQQALLQTLHEVYGHSPTMFNFVLDEMLRRSQIQVGALAHSLVHEVELGKLEDPDTAYQLECCMDRALDFVRATMGMAVQKGVAVVLDADADLAVAPPMDEDQPVCQEDVVKTAVSQARAVFHKLLSAFLIVLSNSNDDFVAKWSAASLLHRMLRVYASTEKQLSQQLQQSVVLSNRRNAQTNAAGLEDGQHFTALMQQLQEAEPAAYRAWQELL